MEVKILSSYSKNIKERNFSRNFRTIDNRINATLKNKLFYDSTRNNGFGGYKYDGRWSSVAEKLKQRYNLKDNSKILQINCDKGYLLYELKKINNKYNIYGLDNSKYSIAKSKPEIKNKIKFYDDIKLPFKRNFFDLIIAIGYIYSFNLKDAIKSLRELSRISNNNKIFISLASYETSNDLFAFLNWTLLGTTILRKKEWKKVLSYSDYKGDYEFTNAKSLNLNMKKN